MINSLYKSNDIEKNEIKKKQNINILLVEDNEMNRKIILKMLGKKDIVCDVAVDGLEALESVKRKKYDVRKSHPFTMVVNKARRYNLPAFIFISLHILSSALFHRKIHFYNIFHSNTANNL